MIDHQSGHDRARLAEERHCTSCRWCKGAIMFPDTPKCTHPETKSEPDIVNGKQPDRYCSNERNYGACGKQGKFWAPRRTWIMNLDLPALVKSVGIFGLIGLSFMLAWTADPLMGISLFCYHMALWIRQRKP